MGDLCWGACRLACCARVGVCGLALWDVHAWDAPGLASHVSAISACLCMSRTGAEAPTCVCCMRISILNVMSDASRFTTQQVRPGAYRTLPASSCHKNCKRCSEGAKRRYAAGRTVARRRNNCCPQSASHYPLLECASRTSTPSRDPGFSSRCARS